MKKIQKKRNSRFLLLLLPLLVIFAACGETKPKVEGEYVETMTSGKLTAYCEDVLIDLMDTTFALYSGVYQNVELTIKTGTSREIMSHLLSGNARIIVIGRDYLADEDSLMTAFDVPRHPFEEIAKDALTFFTAKDTPLDTLNANQIENILTDRTNNFRTFYPQLSSEPIIATCEQNTSIYQNLLKFAANGKQIQRSIRLFSTVDSVRQFVESTPNSIGVLYLHHIHNKEGFKAIPIGYNDTTGRYISPKPVHQAFIIQGLYPYIVTFKTLLLEDTKKLPFWLAAYISREAVVTTYLKEAGTVPTFARFRLIKED